MTALLLLAAMAHAGDGVPDWFVDPEACAPSPCRCADGPLVERFLKNQIRARDAWQSVVDDIENGEGPTSAADADQLFRERFTADPAILAQFNTCSTIGDQDHDPGKIAGFAGIGDIRIDPCYCETFCEDVIEQTIVHEKRHIPTLLGGQALWWAPTAACKLGLAEGYGCDVILPLIRANSEVSSYGAGIEVLESALDDLVQNGDGDEAECTWEPVVAARAAAPAPADGLVPRVRQVVGRFLESVAP